MAILTLASIGVNGADGPDVAWITTLQTAEVSLSPTAAAEAQCCCQAMLKGAVLMPTRFPLAGAAAGPAHHQHDCQRGRLCG